MKFQWRPRKGPNIEYDMQVTSLQSNGGKSLPKSARSRYLIGPDAVPRKFSGLSQSSM